MTVVDWDALPVADPLLSERPMLRGLIESLVDSEAQIGAIRARQAMLFTAITEVVELQTSRLPDAARKDREMPMREALLRAGRGSAGDGADCSETDVRRDDAAHALHTHLRCTVRGTDLSRPRHSDPRGRLRDR